MELLRSVAALHLADILSGETNPLKLQPEALHKKLLSRLALLGIDAPKIIGFDPSIHGLTFDPAAARIYLQARIQRAVSQSA